MHFKRNNKKFKSINKGLSCDSPFILHKLFTFHCFGQPPPYRFISDNGSAVGGFGLRSRMREASSEASGK